MDKGPVRQLVLLRHAKSAWPDVPDHERPLARRGRRDAPGAGRWLRDAGCVPDQVLCSTAVRARQTWQLAQTGLGTSPPVTFERRAYQASAAGLLHLVQLTSATVRTLLIIGHDPAIQDLALTLAEAAPQAGASGAGAGPPPPLDRMRAKFPTAAIAILEFTGPWARLGPGLARLASFVTPRDISARAPGGE
ncbi:MAG TPA: histidine phosphatase family protein [Streptosporangiaceae bacterium]